MNDNKKYLVIFGIFALVIVTTAVFYAFFSYSRVGNTTTTITSGDIEFSFNVNFYKMLTKKLDNLIKSSFFIFDIAKSSHYTYNE